MRAHHAGPALPYQRSAGYRVIDLTGAGMCTVLLRTLEDDPFAALDHMVAGLRGTEPRTATRTISVGCMGFAPDFVVDLWIELLARHGIGSFSIFDCLFDRPKMQQRIAEVVRITVPTCTDKFFASRAEMMALRELDAAPTHPNRAAGPPQCVPLRRGAACCARSSPARKSTPRRTGRRRSDPDTPFWGRLDIRYRVEHLQPDTWRPPRRSTGH